MPPSKDTPSRQLELRSWSALGWSLVRIRPKLADLIARSIGDADEQEKVAFFDGMRQADPIPDEVKKANVLRNRLRSIVRDDDDDVYNSVRTPKRFTHQNPGRKRRVNGKPIISITISQDDLDYVLKIAEVQEASISATVWTMIRACREAGFKEYMCHE